jgi:hypothetical protein
MSRFLSRLKRYRFLNFFWPWKELHRLQCQCHEHWEFGEACLSYLNQIEPKLSHVRLEDKLLCIGTGSTKEVVRTPELLGYWKTKGGFDA